MKHVFYFQVDNPLVKVCDPGFIGRHIAAESEASSKVVAKEVPEEKVGVLVVVNGRCSIVEYTTAAEAPRGRARGRAANSASGPAARRFTCSASAFLERVTRTAAGALPYHVARKKVPDYDPHTRTTIPLRPRASRTR